MQAFAKKHRPKAEEDWITYQDERFGYKLYYPSAIFEPQEPDGAEDSNENDGSSLVLLSDGDEAKIVTFAAENSDDLTPAEYRDTLLNEFGGYDKLDYQPQGKSWFVLSGYRGDTIYYQKVMFSCSNHVVNVFSINFPTADKPYYERLVEIMEDHFKTGRGTDTPDGC